MLKSRRGISIKVFGSLYPLLGTVGKQGGFKWDTFKQQVVCFEEGVGLGAWGSVCSSSVLCFLSPLCVCGGGVGAMWYVLFVYVRVCVHMCLCVKASSWHPVSPSLLSSLLFGMKSLTALNLLIQLDSSL